MFSFFGYCNMFDVNVDGYVCGEGIVVMFVCFLSKVLVSGDYIFVVIWEIGVNLDGRMIGIMMFNWEV